MSSHAYKKGQRKKVKKAKTDKEREEIRNARAAQKRKVKT